MLLLLIGAGGCDRAPEAAVERVRERGFLRVGYSEEPPYAFVDGSGRVRGESPEAVRMVAKRLGAEIRWVRLEFQGLIPALLDGRVDVVASGIFRTPERERLVRFSAPTVCPAVALVVHRGSHVTTLDDFARDDSLRVAVLRGSVEELAAAALDIGGERIVLVPDLSTGLAAVAEGAADAMAVTLPTARRAVSTAPHESLTVRTYRPPPALADLLSTCSALAFRPEDRSLVAAADAALARYVGSAEHVDSLEAFGFSAAELPAQGS